MTWRQLILQHGPAFLDWLSETDAQSKALSKLAIDLEEFLKRNLQDLESCQYFWNAIPLVRLACNINKTYEMPLAAEAYAYVHMLDRYWRTWDVLIELTRKGVLPAGLRGVDVLDVGTGPAPTPYALYDYYTLLRRFGRKNNIIEFAQQTTQISIAESSQAMSRFMHHFSEYSIRPGPFRADIADFADLNPAAKRQKLEQHLRQQDYYDPSSDEFYSEYLPDEANRIANLHQRFRIVIFSNFFTLNETVKTFSNTLDTLYSDLNAGSVVLIIGAVGNQYEKIYNSLSKIAEQHRLSRLFELPETLGENPAVKQAQRVVKNAQNSVYQFLEQIAGAENLPQQIARSKYYHCEFVESHCRNNFSDIIPWPDYWNPEPNPKKRMTFGFRVYRKGRWPT